MPAFATKFMEYLISNGMTETQATEVIQMFKEEAGTGATIMHNRVADYSEQIKNLQFKLLDIVALKYIDAKCPKAWFRPVFDKNDPIWKK